MSFGKINAWLSASIVPKDTPKRKRKLHNDSKADEALPAPECVMKTDTDGNNADTVQDLAENRVENSATTLRNEQESIFYSIEQRTHTKNGTIVFKL